MAASSVGPITDPQGTTYNNNKFHMWMPYYYRRDPRDQSRTNDLYWIGKVKHWVCWGSRNPVSITNENTKTWRHFKDKDVDN